MGRLGHWTNQRRAGGGQFRRANLERDFGLRVAVCAACGGVNPYGRREDVTTGGFVDPFTFNQWARPEHCGHCGEPLAGREGTR